MSLGGFSSILIEGNFEQLGERRQTVFTTGNTLTVGFIVQGVKRMCALEGRSLRDATLLIVGASGDVGSGCARCLAPLVKRVQLNARKVERLIDAIEKGRPEVLTDEWTRHVKNSVATDQDSLYPAVQRSWDAGESPWKG